MTRTRWSCVCVHSKRESGGRVFRDDTHQLNSSCCAFVYVCVRVCACACVLVARARALLLLRCMLRIGPKRYRNESMVWDAMLFVCCMRGIGCDAKALCCPRTISTHCWRSRMGSRIFPKRMSLGLRVHANECDTNSECDTHSQNPPPESPYPSPPLPRFLPHLLSSSTGLCNAAHHAPDGCCRLMVWATVSTRERNGLDMGFGLQSLDYRASV
jgi:hypothetical protein